MRRQLVPHAPHVDLDLNVDTAGLQAGTQVLCGSFVWLAEHAALSEGHTGTARGCRGWQASGSKQCEKHLGLRGLRLFGRQGKGPAACLHKFCSGYADVKPNTRKGEQVSLVL